MPDLKDQVQKIPMYCVKCRHMVDIVDHQSHRLKNGRPAKKGNCPACKTVTFKIVKEQ